MFGEERSVPVSSSSAVLALEREDSLVKVLTGNHSAEMLEDKIQFLTVGGNCKLQVPDI